MDKSITHKLKTTKLTLASNLREDNFFWLYYAGMGDTGIHHIQDEKTLGEINEALSSNKLFISDEIISLPIYIEDSVKIVQVKKVEVNE